LDRAQQIRSEGRWICAAVFLAIVAVYARSLGNAPVWDDRPLVVDNPYLQGWEGLRRIFTSDLWSASAQAEPSRFYRPMTMLTFWVNALIGGRSAASFRLGNVLIHATNAVLIAALARKMRAAGWITAGMLALGWAIAPICSEPVMWISGRFDLLVVTFALLALLSARIESPAGLWLTLLSIFCGILCKESFIVWLPIVVLDDWLVRKAQQRGWVKYGGIASMVAAYFLVRRWLDLPSAAVAIHTGAVTFVESFFFLVATFGRVLVWPTNLDPFRPYAPLSAFGLAITILLSLLVAGAAVAGTYRHRDSIHARVGLFGVAWFAVATLPSALVGPNLDIVGDRYAYLPLVGLFLTMIALVGWVASHLRSHTNRAAGWRLAGKVCAVGLLLSEGWSTVRRSAAWRDDTVLARASLASNPGNAYALCSLGSMAAQRGDLDAADALLADSLDRNRDAWRTWDAICFVRLHQGRLDEAERACREGLDRLPENPRGWVNLASIYVRAKRWHDASFAAEHAVKLKARYGEARYLAAAAAANLGNMEQARAHLARGLEADPDNPRLRDLERQFQAPPH
jgi:protein O-mannosyl-transferase